MTRNSTFLPRRTALAAAGVWLFLLALGALAQKHDGAAPVRHGSAPGASRGDSSATHYRTVRIDGLDLFYRRQARPMLRSFCCCTAFRRRHSCIGT